MGICICLGGTLNRYIILLEPILTLNTKQFKLQIFKEKYLSPLFYLLNKNI